MQRNDGGSSIQVLTYFLCKKFSGTNENLLNSQFKSSLVTLSSNISPLLASTEIELVDKIKRKLVHGRSYKYAADFSELYRKLQAHEVLSDRWAILYLLYKLANFEDLKRINKVEFTGFVASTPISHNGFIPHSLSTIHASKDALRGFVTDIAPSTSSEISSILSHIKSSKFPDASGDKKSSLASSLRSTSSLKVDHGSKSSSNLSKVHSSSSQDYPDSVLRDVIYVLQGIDGKLIVYDKERQAYKIITQEVEISHSACKMVSRLCECGFVHNKVRSFVDAEVTDQTQGLVRQSFCSSLHQELIEYYRIVANIEAQIQQEMCLGISGGSTQSLTLRRMLVWLTEPTHRLTVLASLVDVCQGRKGGELASVVHSFTKHGDPSVRALTTNILSLVGHPFFNFILRWIYDGELEDPFQEFFVASDPKVKDDRLWREKYSLRKNMIPSFITSDQARKILLTGKTISFLRRVCADRSLIKDRDIVKASDTSRVETMFSHGQDGNFTKMIDVVYKETSSYLLKVLYEKYKFMDHLKAMRKYLLLGQGDFIRHLMDLLEEDLAKPAQTIHLHNLTGILESAIRATNVQYEDPDIVERLDVQRLEVSPGDTGWMVFSLAYHVSGHIRTVFTPESMATYLKVSNFLWKAKRMEYILSVVWKEQMSHARIFRPYSEFSSVLLTSQLIASEMLHFVQQIQYYINFEVLECSWVELMMKVGEADDMDQVISAHQEFLNAITSRSLLDPMLKANVTKMKEIFDLVIRFQNTQVEFHSKMMSELDARKQFNLLKDLRTQQGDRVTNEEVEQNEKECKEEFVLSFVQATKSELENIGRSYKKKVEEFLSLIGQHEDVSLRCLTFRLNFNERYKYSQHQSRASIYKVNR